MLTEPSRFDGDLAHLEEVAAAVPATPVMRKDFLVDLVQMLEARKAGASGVLLIATMLSDTTLREMLDAAWQHGMFVLLESFDEDDLDDRRDCSTTPTMPSAPAPGNSWSASTPATCARSKSTTPAAKTCERLPASPCVAESGLRVADDAANVAAWGIAWRWSVRR